MDKQLTKQHFNEVCQFAQGSKTWAFISSNGMCFTCAKGQPEEAYIRQRLAEGTMNAKGDNCDGRSGTLSIVDLRQTILQDSFLF